MNASSAMKSARIRHTMVMHIYFKFHKCSRIGYWEQFPDGRTYGRTGDAKAIPLAEISMEKKTENRLARVLPMHVCPDVRTTLTQYP